MKNLAFSACQKRSASPHNASPKHSPDAQKKQLRKGNSKKSKQYAKHVNPAASKESTRTETPLTLENFSQVLCEYGFALSDTTLTALMQYLDLLLRWNRVMNLIGTHSWQQATRELLIDCLYLPRFLEQLPLPSEPNTWDLGSGAGLPGIPLRLLWAKGSYSLVDTRGKRILFLRQVLGTLPIQNTFVYQADVQDFFKTARPADLVISRAFMPWPQLLDLLHPVLQEGSIVVFMSGLDRPSPHELPQGYTFAASFDYEVKTHTRRLWAARRTFSMEKYGGDKN